MNEKTDLENHLINFSNEIKKIADQYFPLEKMLLIPLNRRELFYLQFPATYIIFHEKEIIYIGVSDCVGSRILGHFGNFKNEITEIKIIRFNSWDEAAILEAYLITEFKPKYNKKIESLRQYEYRLSDKTIHHLYQIMDLIMKELKHDQTPN